MGHLTSPTNRPPFLGIVCGLHSERRCAERALGPLKDRAKISVSGASARRAAAQAEALVAGGAGALVSFGLAAALDPQLRPGQVVVARRVLCQTGAFGTGKSAVWGSDRMIGDPAEKARIHARTGAAILDMESHSVARAADCAGVPFVVLRAVSDDAQTALPAYLARAVSAGGNPRLATILAGLARAPSSLPTLIRLGRDSARSLAALQAVAGAELPALLRSLDAG